MTASPQWEKIRRGDFVRVSHIARDPYLPGWQKRRKGQVVKILCESAGISATRSDPFFIVSLESRRGRVIRDGFWREELIRLAPGSSGKHGDRDAGDLGES